MDEERGVCHGDYSIRVFSQLVAVRIFGAWNLECARRYRQETRRVYDEFEGRRFISLIDLREWELATPEAIELLSRPTGRRAMEAETGVREIQIGTPESLQLVVSRSQIDRSVRGVVYVNTPQEALAILRDEGLVADAEEMARFLDSVSPNM